MLTYGNVLYDFCQYRMKLKFFHKKRLWIRKIHKLLNLTYEVVRAITKDDHLPYIEEFYREYNYKKYQSQIRKNMKTMVAQEMKDKQTAGKDFNSFILQYKQDPKNKENQRQASEFLVKQVQLMHRVAILQLKVHHVMMYNMQDR